METTFPHIDHMALTDKVYAVLREKILLRELKSGEKVHIDEIASQLGVSRTPVKDAVNRLALEGLVEKVARRGTFVTELTLRDVAELFDLRLLLETYAAKNILETNRTEPLLAEMKTCLTYMQRAIDGDEYLDYEGFMAWDRDLHLCLIKLADNRQLLQTYQGLNIHIQIARAHYLRSVEGALQAQQEHKAIYEAFQSGDVEQVNEALSTHVNNVKTGVLKSLKLGNTQL
ncbi:MAG TPA: GntR family transcriptional regulator [Anaerolineae bacterium]|nr:GntR family transcriptional regulator [Anaerolineae bacterium]